MPLEPEMNRHPSQTTEVSATRRKVIRAGFAVPAIATVASGSALAATSATCLARQTAGSNGTYPAVSTSANPDTFLRVQLGVYEFKNKNTPSVYYVDGSALDATLSNSKIKKSGQYLVKAGNFQLFNIATNEESGGLLTTQPNGGSNGNDGAYKQLSGHYAVLRFDSLGYVVGVGKPTSGTGMSAVQASCWSSIAAGRA